MTETEHVEVRAEESSEDRCCDPTLFFWHVQEGDSVTRCQDMCELESACGAVVVPSPVTGVLKAILVREGDTVVSGQLLARILPVEA